MAAFYTSRILLFFHVILIFKLVTQGVSQTCTGTYKDIELLQSETGDSIGGKPQYLVELFNQCGKCGQFDVTLDCTGFQTVYPFPIDLTKDGNDCVVSKGFAINPLQEASFKYAWDTQFPFRVISSTPRCD